MKLNSISKVFLSLAFVINAYANDFNTTLQHFDKLCKQNDAKACFSIGSWYYQGDGVEQNLQKAKEYYKKACDKNFASGCGMLGSFYEKNKNLKQAQIYYEKGCALNEAMICDLLGNLLNFEKKDYVKAKTIYQKACNLNSGFSCGALADFYLVGRGVKKDDSNALFYYRRGCDLGDERSCSQATKLTKTLNDINELMNDKAFQDFMKEIEKYNKKN